MVFFKSYNVILDGALERYALKGENYVNKILNLIGSKKITILVFHIVMPIISSCKKVEYTHLVMKCGKIIYDEYFLYNYRLLKEKPK